MEQLCKTDYIILENGDPIRGFPSRDIIIYGDFDQIQGDIYQYQLVCPVIYAPANIQAELLIQINKD